MEKELGDVKQLLRTKNHKTCLTFHGQKSGWMKSSYTKYCSNKAMAKSLGHFSALLILRVQGEEGQGLLILDSRNRIAHYSWLGELQFGAPCIFSVQINLNMEFVSW